MFIYCTKESDPIREPDPEIEGVEHFKKSSSRIFWRQKLLVIKDLWILKISCVIQTTLWMISMSGWRVFFSFDHFVLGLSELATSV